MPTMGDKSANESANAERNLKSLTGRRCSGSSVIEISVMDVLPCDSGHVSWAGDPVGVRGKDRLRAGTWGYPGNSVFVGEHGLELSNNRLPLQLGTEGNIFQLFIGYAGPILTELAAATNARSVPAGSVWPAAGRYQHGQVYSL